MRRFRTIALLTLPLTAGLFFVGITSVNAQRLPGTPQEEARLRDLALGLRCPVCQSENIFESQALVAREMLVLAQEQIRAGKTDAEIYRFFRERYGDYVLLSPPANGAGLIVWAVPLALALGALLVVLRQMARRKRHSPAARAPLTEAGLEELEP